MPLSSAPPRVTVTGASGFIGRRLLRALHARGCEVVAIVAGGRRTDPLDTLGFPVKRILVDDPTRIGEAILEAGVPHIVHLSAHILTHRTLESIHQSMQWNLLSSVSLMTAALELKAERVVLMGSCEEYRESSAPFDTEHVADPNSPYGASKAAVTAYARMFFNSFGLPTVVLRPSVVYGPDQSPQMLIPQVMAALASHREIDVTAGEQTRDFLFVDDLVDAILLSLHLPNLAGRAWNIGSGELVTVRDCLEKIEQIAGLSGLIGYGKRPYPPREIYHYALKLDDTFAAFGWQPQTMLSEGLRATWDAIRNRESNATRTGGIA